VMSWLLNVVRIAILILIGAYVSPDLAVNGFHSYAGWLFFTLLALGMLFLVQSIPWLQRTRRSAPATALRDDWVAACILPFVVFMLASVLVSALSPVPDLAYPVKALAIGAVLAVFVRAYRRLEYSHDPVAALAGLAVGVIWVLTSPQASAQDSALAVALAGLGPVLLALWVASRIIGTVLLVPLVEELFFRGYLLARLDLGGPWGRGAAIMVSSLLFAALHGRWMAAAAAGVVFAVVQLRRGRLADAVIAHTTANLVIATPAALLGDWSLI